MSLGRPMDDDTVALGVKVYQCAKAFTLYRESDESGVSGTGRVLDGCVFHTGQVVVCWRTDIDAAKHGYSSVALYPSWEAFKFIHVKSHPTNGTRVVWL
jgi:hypothetical protein